jgi:hypothetical protein
VGDCLRPPGGRSVRIVPTATISRANFRIAGDTTETDDLSMPEASALLEMSISGKDYIRAYSDQNKAADTNPGYQHEERAHPAKPIDLTGFAVRSFS